MSLRKGFAILVGLGLTFGVAAESPRVPVAVAAAGDLRGTLEELKAGFEARQPGVQLQLTFGASGTLTAQILQGAPFDVFLSADTACPEQLVQAGLASPAGLFPYATGALVLWVHKELGLDPAKAGLRVLLEPGIKRIATANPLVAPYGRAGEAALRQAGLYDTLKPRLVFADNIAQAAQFLQTGAAAAGLISRSQAGHPALAGSGQTWIVPAGSYPPLRQAGLLLKRSACADQAQAFRAFLTGPEGQTILQRHGFGKP